MVLMVFSLQKWAYSWPDSQASKIWSCPPAGEIKLNSDAAVRPGSGFIGVGAAGSVVVSLSKPIFGDFPVKVWELLALREEVFIANNVAGPIFNDSKVLFGDVGVVSCQHVLQSRNMVAHTLAALALSSRENCLWLDNKPDCVASLL
ncbi:hypothetical protein ACOSP7_024424 [Xanthoceras sorbifolium]